MKSLKPIIPIILILIGLGVGFFGGYEYRNYKLNQNRSQLTGTGNFQRFTGTGTRNGGAGGIFRGGVITGSILSMDQNSITVKLVDGSTKIIILSASTSYENILKASLTDLKTGSAVMVFGTPNSDGSVTATNVQINPMTFRPQQSSLPTSK